MGIPFIARFIRPVLRVLDMLTPLGDFLARLWVAKIFFQAGLVKLQAWQSTMLLFEHEYQVPLLSAKAAAVIGTGAELILPVLLLIGLGGRLMVAVFFSYNLLVMFSYPFLWTPEGMMGLEQHINWALLLALLMFHGPGCWSIDAWLRRRHGHHLTRGDTQ